MEGPNIESLQFDCAYRAAVPVLLDVAGICPVPVAGDKVNIYLHGRDIFIRLLGEGADFIAATEAREAYTREHLWCKRCNEVKHRSCFYHLYGTLPQFPCRQCKTKTQREWIERKIREASPAGGG